ncbi:hypothetical protein CHARACLAT_029090, partial [Characodon lateralis]|nr:hypothetical protein [Characodon lateralis]
FRVDSVLVIGEKRYLHEGHSVVHTDINVVHLALSTHWSRNSPTERLLSPQTSSSLCVSHLVLCVQGVYTQAGDEPGCDLSPQGGRLDELYASLVWPYNESSFLLSLVWQLTHWVELINRELRQANCAKLESPVAPDVQKSSPPPSAPNHLPQSPPEMPASAHTAPSASPAAPTEPAASPPPPAPSAPAKLLLGPYTAGFSSRKKKRRMGTYSLVPKKKTKVLKQRTMLEMFKELQQSTKTQQKREVANINGEKVVNASEEDESEDLESEEEMRRQPAEQTLSAVQETSESADQVKDEHESEDSEEEEDEGEEDGTESDLSFESSLKKKLKKKSKADSAWLRPSRKRKRRTAPKEPETDVLPQTSGQECTQILPSECVHLSKSSHTKGKLRSSLNSGKIWVFELIQSLYCTKIVSY